MWKWITGGLLLLWNIVNGLLDYLGKIDQIVAYSEDLGWIGTVLSHIVRPPSWVILPTIFIGLVLIYLDMRRRQFVQEIPISKAAEEFKLSDWIDHDTYYVWAAACLWIEVKPVNQIDVNHPAYPSMQMIKGALDIGQIKSIGGGANMNARVPRSELQKLANAKKSFPKFLFPRGLLP